jgi:hypothetical protein
MIIFPTNTFLIMYKQYIVNEGQPAGGPCVPKRWGLARGEMPHLLPQKHLIRLEKLISFRRDTCLNQVSSPCGNKKAIKHDLCLPGSSACLPCKLSFLFSENNTSLTFATRVCLRFPSKYDIMDPCHLSIPEYQLILLIQ